MSIAINQLPTLLTSTIIFMFIILLVLMSITLMQTYRNKNLYLLFIVGLGLSAIQQIFLLINFNSSMSVVTYTISTVAGMVSFIIVNFVLMTLSIANGKVKSLPYTLFAILILIGGVLSAYLEKQQAFSATRSYSLPILELSFIVIMIVLLTQIKVVRTFTYHVLALSMLLVSNLAQLFHHYLMSEYTLWLHITASVSYSLYYLFILLLLFTLVTEKMMNTYLNSINDQMTGLYLRQSFIKKVTKLSSKKQVAILFSDIDNFKRLNDTKGHLEADQVLIKVAQIIKEESAKYGYSGRYGGEEIVAGIDISHAKPEVIAESIRKRVADETIVTVSIGISTSKDSTSLDELLRYADEAMYYAKTTGKNKVCLYKSLPAALKK